MLKASDWWIHPPRLCSLLPLLLAPIPLYEYITMQVPRPDFQCTDFTCGISADIDSILVSDNPSAFTQESEPWRGQLLVLADSL